MRWVGALALVVVTGLAVGCQDNKLQDQNQQLTQQNKQLQDRVTQLQQQAAQAQRMQADLAARDARIRQLEEQAKAGKAPGLEGLETSYNPRSGELTVNLSSDILFDSGSVVLKRSSLAALNKVAAALKREYAGKPVRVEGHTDTDPIIRGKSRWQDNLDLSLGRAAAVTRYLEKSGIDPARVTTSGFGEYHPRDTKDLSRRVEIVVLTRGESGQANPALRPTNGAEPADESGNK